MEFYEIAAKHLKKCFNDIKIGGPALAGNLDFAEDFLAKTQENNIPLDFFSWHIYCDEPKIVTRKAEEIKALLNKYGFGEIESILNEWNYVKGWGEEFVYTIESIHGIKGAAFMMSVISEAQKTDIDMLMYYDTRPSVFNGVFDFYTYKPLKGYYPLYWYGFFYDHEEEIRATQEHENIYTLAGINKDGKITAIITNYSDNDNAPSKDISVDFGKTSLFDIYLLDKNNDATLIKTVSKLDFTIENQSCILIKEQ